MLSYQQEYAAFKKAAILSIFVHVLLFLFILLAPYLPKPAKQGMVHYVNLVGGLPGGGGSGGGGGLPGGGGATPSETEEVADTEVPVSESLQDLTTPQKAQQPETSPFRYPVDKPNKESKPKSEKTAVVQKREPSKKTTSSNTKSGQQGRGSGGGGRGLSFGFGTGSGSGSGFGFGSGSGSGIANFPYAYYVQSLQDRIAGNWLQSRVSTLTEKNLYTDVYFRIQKDGSMTHLEVKHRCGIRALDMNALRAVQDSSPFPPLPREYEDEYLVVNLRFEHSQ